MDFKKCGSKFILRIDKNEELVSILMNFCVENYITLGSVSGIGATNKAVLGLFDVNKKQYFSKEFNGDFEIAPVVGNISTMNDKTYLHLHANICDSNQNSFGGHLNSAVISATCELFIDVYEGSVDREFNEDVGLNLIKF
ncbi:DNA-binding protein [Candidatus Woesearchaeota archaeon]|nr:DNA-binding protein [Candidatus Woesearchaeota archaeon]